MRISRTPSVVEAAVARFNTIRKPGLGTLPAGEQIASDLTRSKLTHVLNVEEKVDKRVGIVHPAQAENDVGMEAG